MLIVLKNDNMVQPNLFSDFDISFSFFPPKKENGSASDCRFNLGEEEGEFDLVFLKLIPPWCGGTMPRKPETVVTIADI